MSSEADAQKTRRLPRGPAGATGGASPAGDGGGEKIVFSCPNGHRIVVDAGLAGKQGKCTKCNVDVTIPRATTQTTSPRPTRIPPSAAAGPVIVAPHAPVVAAPGSQPSLAEPAVGPPAALEVAEGEPEELEAVTGETSGAEDWHFIGGEPQPPAADGLEAGWPATAAVAGDGGDNPTAVLVARLWAEREHGGVIELHLEGGSVILPEWYDANWSRGTHGLFASLATDGSVTLTAVAWETVRKVVVRQLKEVPNDMFN